MPLPSSFNSDGLLDPGIYCMTLGELRDSWLVTGDRLPASQWDSHWRGILVDNLALLVRQLRLAASLVPLRSPVRVFVGGSFTENKARPYDLDGCYQCHIQRVPPEELARFLRMLDNVNRHGDWMDGPRPEDRPMDRHTRKRHIRMWHRYRVELFRDDGLKNPNLLGKNKEWLTWVEFFSQARDQYKPKGIIEIV